MAVCHDFSRHLNQLLNIGQFFFYISEPKWLTRGKIKTTLRINKNLIPLYLQTFSCLQFGDADPKFRYSGECHASIDVEDLSSHIKVSWFSSADFGPKTPLLSFFFSVCETKQKELNIRTIQVYRASFLQTLTLVRDSFC